MILLACPLYKKLYNVYNTSFCRQQDYYKEEKWGKKKEPAGKRFCANLKSLIDFIHNTDSEKNTDDEEIDVTVDRGTPKKTRKGKFYKINL